MIQIKQIFSKNRLRNFNYLIIGESSDIFVIDPYDAKQLIPIIDSLGGKVKAIINTHEHFDHVMGNNEIKEHYNCEIYAHENALGKIQGVDRFLEKDDEIEIDHNHKFLVMDTPGHTHAHLCLLLKKHNKAYAVFTGDTLFNAGVGNCHNGGDPEVLYETIKDQFMTLDDEILVYPGHEYLGNNLGFTLNYEPCNRKAKKLLDEYKEIDPDETFFVTNVAKEKEINTFLRLGNDEIQDTIGVHHDEKQVFLKLRELRNKW